MHRFVVLLLLLSLVFCGDEGESIRGQYVGVQNFGIGQVSSPIRLDLREKDGHLSGSVTPPFRERSSVSILGGIIRENRFYFEAEWDQVVFAYQGILRGDTIQGEFQPVGCLDASRGPCLTDSNGSFTARKIVGKM